MPVYNIRIQSCIIGLIALLVLDGCKKGENDPTISLRSRKARLTGEWEVKSANWAMGDTVQSYDGTDLITTLESGEADTFQVEMSFEFTKDGDYKIETISNYPADYQGSGMVAFSTKNTEDGVWNFAGGEDGTPAKSRLLLLTTQLTLTSTLTGSNIDITTFDGQTGGFIYDIDRLENKKMDLEYTFSEITATETMVRSGALELTKK